MKLRKLRRVIRRLKPIRGYRAWEVQVGPFVFMWLHRANPTWQEKLILRQYPTIGQLSWWRIFIFKDPYWRLG